MSDYTFDFNQADATVYDMNQITQRINSALAEMETAVEARMQDWDGSAKSQYAISKAQWDKSAGDMGVFLEQARLTLLQISDNYGTTEQRHAMLWNDVRGG